VPAISKSRIARPQPAPTEFGGRASAGGSYGLTALFDELEEQGVATRDLLAGTGIPPSWRQQADAALSHAQRVALFSSAQRLARRPDAALRAGQRQKIGDFGVWGYAMATSPTFGDAFRFGRDHLPLAGPVLRITFERRGDTGVLISNNPESLGTLLPFVAEFWRSSMTTLLSLVLGAPFPSRAMYFPYQAPAHASACRKAFPCPIHFGSNVMEWHFDAAVFEVPCPNASAMTAGLCREFCERVVASGEGQSPLQREVRAACLDTQGREATAATVAAALGMSLRTFHRRLRAEQASFQRLLDEVRCSIAVEYLANTRMPVEEIGHRIGFPDPSNFRKAFRRWTGRPPSSYRDAASGPQ
jgi:AraC-like DNA-binding protein